MTIHFDCDEAIHLSFNYEDLIASVIEKVLEYEQCPYEAEINVVLTNNEEIKQVNKEFRNIDKPTDVLSFPMLEYENPSEFDDLEEAYEYFHPETGELLLGDIMISVERAEEQAKEYGHTLQRELAFLIAHSMLHLCGYDHIEKEECIVMEQKQKDILEILGITRE